MFSERKRSNLRKTGPDKIFTQEQLLDAYQAMHKLTISTESSSAIVDALELFMAVPKSPYEQKAEPRRRFAEVSRAQVAQADKLTSQEEKEAKLIVFKSHRKNALGTRLFGKNYKAIMKSPLIQQAKERKRTTFKNAGRNTL